MKKLNNKKGLFLAEILLAVVIAAVIMGSGFLVYKNIKSENEKNDGIRDLNMIISMATPIFADERGMEDRDGDGTNSENPQFMKTGVFVDADLFPNTVLTNKFNDRAQNEAISAFGYPMSIGIWEKNENSLWRVRYQNLNVEQCLKFTQAAIKATKPMIVAHADAGTTGPLKQNAVGSFAVWGNHRIGICAADASAIATATAICTAEKNNITFVYSPNNEPSGPVSTNPTQFPLCDAEGRTYTSII